MNHPSVNIFVLNWNGRDLTMDCLKSLEQVNYSAHKVYVIDNGSIIDEGNHEELMKTSEIYKSFYEKQLRKD